MSNPLAKRRDETDLQYRTRMALADVSKRDKSAVVLSQQDKARGYRKEFVTHVETNTKTQAVVNRGGTALDRWYASNKLTPTQVAAIHLCLRLWRLAGRNEKLTANYGERVVGLSLSGYRSTAEIDARKHLHELMDYFPGPLRRYWSVFEDVCRYDVRADVAGAALSPSKRSADARAHTVVCFVADIIADRERL